MLELTLQNGLELYNVGIPQREISFKVEINAL